MGEERGIVARKRARLVKFSAIRREATTTFSKAEARPDEAVHAKCILRAHGGEIPFFFPSLLFLSLSLHVPPRLVFLLSFFLSSLASSDGFVTVALAK